MKKSLCSLLGLLLFASITEAKNSVPQSAIPEQSLRFTENRGQVVDDKGNTRPDILYTASVSGATVYFRKDAISYVFAENKTKNGQNELSALRTDIVLKNANPSARVTAYQPQLGVNHYYLSHGAFTGVQSFGKIVYQNIYPNVDLVFYPAGTQLKYEFVVHKGGQVKDIQMEFAGFQNMEVNRDGSLSARHALGSYGEDKPVSYELSGIGTDNQVLKNVSSAFNFQNGILTFEVGGYDKNIDLVIDPLTRIWAGNVGGNRFDRALGVAVDNSDNITYTGFTASANFPTTPGVVQTTFGGNNDIIVARYNSSNALAWATYYGGSGVDQGLSIASDNSGHSVIVGYSQSSDFPVTITNLPNDGGRTSDGFVLDLNSDGTRNWATLFGGSSSDQLWSVAVSSVDGSIYTVGRTFSSGLATLGGNVTNANTRDAVLLKLTSAGARTWSTYYGGSNDDQATAVALDANDNVYVAGFTKSTDLPLGGTPFQATNAGADDVFLAQYSSAGTRNWGTYYGGATTDQVNGITFNRTNNNVYIVGQTASSNFPITGGSAFGGVNDGFLVGFNTTGTRTFGRFLGSANSDLLYGVGTIGTKIYVAGGTLSTSVSPNNPNAVDLPFQSSNAGALDVFVMKIDASASNSNTNDWSFMYGATGDDVARALATNNNGKIAIVGYTNSPTFPVFNRPDPNQSAAATGNDDAFVLSLTDEVGSIPCTPFTTTATKTDPTCDVSADGTITVQQPTQASTLTYTLLSNGNPVTQSSNAFKGLAAGTYTVRADDSNGNCTDDSDPIILTAGPNLTVTTTNVDPACLGQSNGSITVTAPVGANFRYTITGSAEQSSAVFNNRAAGNYVVTVRNIQNGCTGASNPITLSDPAPVTATVTNTTLPCGQTTGSLTVNASGGTAPYVKYEITGTGAKDNGNNPIFTGLTVGQYNFRVTDSKGCTVTTAGAVLNNAIEVGAIGSPTTCGLQNGSMIVNFVNGGTPPYKYRLRSENGRWIYPPNKLNGVIDTSFNSFFENIAAGIYFVEVYDSRGCVGITINSDVKNNPNTLALNDLLFNNSDCRTGATNLTVLATSSKQPISYRLSGPMGTVTQTNNFFSNLIPGSYVIELTDNDGCTIPSRAFDVAQPDPLRLNIIFTEQPNCLGGVARGSVLVAPSPTPYPGSIQYFIGNSDFTSVQGPFLPQGFVFDKDFTFTELAPGDYKIFARSNTGCADTISVTITDANGITITNLTTQAPTCGGRADAQLSVDITGGTAPIKYELFKDDVLINSVSKQLGDPELQTNNYTNLASGNYKVVITDVNTCTSERSAVISEPTPLKIVSFTKTAPTFCGGQDGRVTINVTGGSGDYLYTLNNTVTSANATIEDVPAGYYTVRVEDAIDVPDGVERCHVDSFFVLNDPGSPQIINVQSIDAACANDPDRTNTGQIIVSVSSAVRPLYFYNQGFSSTPVIVNASTHTFRNLGPGTYNIVVATDAFPTGCAAYYPPVTISSPSPLIVKEVKILSQPFCGPGNTGGTLQVTAEGGSGNYSYSIDNGLSFQTSPIFTNVYPNAGGYTAVVRDLNGGCTVAGGTYFLANPSGLEIAEPPILTPPTCGQNNGSIKVIPKGNSTPRFYSINGGNETSSSAGSFTFSNLGSGTYTVRVRDNQGCKAIAIVNFSEIAIGDLATTKPTCGQNDGAITMRMAGGSGSYKFKVTGSAFDGTNVTTGPVSFGPISGLAVGTISLTDLGPGTYDVEITDSLGSCTITQRVNLSSNGGPAIPNVLVQNRTCNAGTGNGAGGAISIFATGPADRFYMFGPNGQTFNKINVAPLESGTFSSANNGGQNLPAGTYYVFASRNNCLTAGGAYTITEPEIIKINDVVITQPTCMGGTSTQGSIKIMATGGTSLQYSRDGQNWQSGNTFTNLSPDPTGFNVFVREAGSANCQVQWPFQILITNPTGMSIRTIQVNNPQCNSTNTGSIQVRVTSGTPPYKMYIGGNEDGTLAAAGLYTFSNLSAGTYTIVVTDANNCADRITATLANPNNIQFVNTGFTIVQPGACIGGSINLDFSGVNPPGNYEYALYDGAFQQLGTPFNNLTSGVYKVTVRDANVPNCTKDTLIYLNSTSSVPLISMDGITKNNISCFGAQDGQITVFASTPVNTSGTVQISINGTTPNSSNPAAMIVQSGQPATFSNLGPGTYEIVIANGDEGPPLPPNYCVSAIGSYRIRVEQPQRIIINEVKTTDQNCAAGVLGQIEITAFGGSGEFQYSINGGVTWQNSNIFTDLQPSNLFADGVIVPETYRVSVRDKRATNCTVNYTGVARIRNRSQMFFVFDAQADVVNVTCPGQSNGSIRFNVNVNVNAVPTPFPIKYYLNGILVHTASNASLLTRVVRNLGVGTYEMKAVDNTGCEIIQTASVGVFEGIELNATVVQQPRTCGATLPQEQGLARVTVRGGQEENIEYKLVRDGDTLISGVVSLFDPNELFWSIQAPDIYTRDFSELGPGYYQIVMRIRGANCWTKDTFVLRDPGTPIIRTVNTTMATNQVCSNGQADIIIFGGGINIKYEILDEFGRNVFRPLQSSSKFALPAGKYVARVRTGLGVDVNNNPIPFCYSTYGPFTVGCTFGREEVASNAQLSSTLSVYPNPNRGTFSVNVSVSESQAIQLQMIDVTGRIVWSQNTHLTEGANSIPVEVNDLTTGLYILNCKTSAGTHTTKLMVE